jgi:hypothetical protein
MSQSENGQEKRGAQGLAESIGCLVVDANTGEQYGIGNLLKKAQDMGLFVVFSPDGTAMMVKLEKGAEFFVGQLMSDVEKLLLQQIALGEKETAEYVQKYGMEAITKAVTVRFLFGELPEAPPEVGA